MKVCVVGLWHLGSVTAACLADGGHDVTGLDFDAKTIEGLKGGKAPLFEPGLDDLIAKNIAAGRLRFTVEAAEALRGASVAWVTYDTPVDSEDRADVEFVAERIARLFPHLENGTLVLISSQLPVGTVRRAEEAFAKARPGVAVTFGCSPENLRLGKAISVFTQPDRVVVGLRSPADKVRVEELLKPFTQRIEWMSVESAEMTKHALNAFLATCVTFINEVATICEQVGADAKEVERGLKSEQRIGPKAYLGPGGAFAGGTLARDIQFLSALAEKHGTAARLIPSVGAGNQQHKAWPRRKLGELLGELKGRKIAVWGLTYKPGTDTLRRSSSVELCLWLAQQGAMPMVHDPAVKLLPPELADKMKLCPSAMEALAGADALVVGTEWPDYQAISAKEVSAAMQTPVVVDANRFLNKTLGSFAGIRYAAVGVPSIAR